ncbi:leucyl aminopeptidase [Microbacterium sp. 22215]|uniref:leucyl aminopeptidase n=1 Tax=Microbacterium sp. 22215 TaxID=3453893 RepID=UPI003F8414A7
MTRSPNKLIPADFPTLPSLTALESVRIGGDVDADADVEAIGYGVFSDTAVPPQLGLSRAALSRAGFESKVGESLVLPQPEGPDLIVVGLGETERVTPGLLRDAGAAFARASARRGSIRFVLPSVERPIDADSIRAAYEGMLLARYRYTPLKSTPKDAPLTAVSVLIDGTPSDHDGRAVEDAAITVRAAAIARDLASTPPGHLTAADMGDIAVQLGERFGFDVELFDKAALIELGCGGLLGVNQGSVEEPRMIKLHYSPESPASGHLGLIGKGIMYDSGGISLKPSDPMHLLMKMDMGGAAAVLGAFTGFRHTGADAEVTGWLMCTDNMPSGTSYKLGDVLTARGGTTIEVKNTDAEGRLVMADAFVLANEEGVDAIVDIATLTGAALAALGPATAPVFANDDALAEAVLAASASTGEPVWRMPLEPKYRTQLDSDIADISNLGGPYAGATTAALFLEHFVDDTPWVHIDIAGTMQSDGDDAWRSKGATGFGARLLLEVAAGFRSDS